MIISADNPKVKQARALLERKGRRQQGQCLIEGVRLVEDVMGAGVQPALLFFQASARELPRARALLDAVATRDIPLWELSPALFETLADTATSQGLIAVIPARSLPPPADPSLALVLDEIRDPGNLGTMLRSAAAAGAVDAILMTAGCADPWSPKVLRAGMGAHFRIPFRVDVPWRDVAALAAGRSVWLADAGGEVPYDQVDWTRPSVLVIGGEATGASAAARSLDHRRVAIPMAAGAESLNAAMATTVLLFEAARQRRAPIA